MDPKLHRHRDFWSPLVPDSKDLRNPASLSYMKKKGRSVAPIAKSSHSITIARVGHTSIHSRVNKTDKAAFVFSNYFF